VKRIRQRVGQSLVETAIVLPLLLSLLALGYWGFRRLSHRGAAMSAAQVQLLRTGRGQLDTGNVLAGSVCPSGEGVTVSARNGSLPGGIPPFTGLSGRTISSVDVSRPPEKIAGGFVEPPRHDFRIRREGAVDCWGIGSRSGRNVRRTVQGILVTGALR
jgi:hypothetical protein